jgi:glycosyltransferase involved in cell wall biosynthesis
MISVVLATFNEEKNIRRCLDSVKQWADEIIVVDGTSSDKTQAIARSYTSRVYQTTNKPVFHINKQIAMDKAQGNLVLQLDADEVVDDDLALFIQQLDKELKGRRSPDHKRGVVAWWVRRKNLFLGRFLHKGGQYPDPVIRLYINGYASLPQKDVHEQMKVDGNTGWADGHLIHYSNPEFGDYLRKFNTYTSLSASFMLQEGNRVSWSQAIVFITLKPWLTFFQLYFRHKGFLDGFPGFVFALMSALHHPVTYLKLWEKYEQEKLNE